MLHSLPAPGFSRHEKMINFSCRGFQGGYPPLLQCGDEDVCTVRRGDSPLYKDVGDGRRFTGNICQFLNMHIDI